MTPRCPLRFGATLLLLLTVAACDRANETEPAAVSTGNTGESNKATDSGNMPTTTQVPMPVSGSDRAFVAEAAHSGLAEVEASRFMAEHASRRDIKSFAEKMEREHRSGNDELKRIAGNKGIALPNSVEGDLKTRLHALKILPPAEADAVFLRDFGIDAHQKAISLFEQQLREGQDAELRTFAEQSLPRLREHLAHVQQLSGQKKP